MLSSVLIVYSARAVACKHIASHLFSLREGEVVPDEKGRKGDEKGTERDGALLGARLGFGAEGDSQKAPG